LNTEQGILNIEVTAAPLKGGMKGLETTIKKWLRPMWEAASGGRTGRAAKYDPRMKTLDGDSARSEKTQRNHGLKFD
jgi:hypothetical protein